MSASAPQLEERTGASQSGVIRLARYSVYPRAASEHAVQTGLTRDSSGAALQLVTTNAEAVGELLRVEIQDFSHASRDQASGADEPVDVLARVVSCQRRGNGRFELALERLDARRPLFARPPKS